MFGKKKSTRELVQPDASEDALPEKETSSGGKKKKKVKKERSPREGGKLSLREVVKSRPFVGGLCIVLGLLIAFVAMPLVQMQIAQTVPVVVLKQAESTGTQLTADMVETRKMGALNLPADRIRDADGAVGKYLNVAGAAGDILTGSRLADSLPGDDPELARLPEGKMAMSATLAELAQNVSGKLRAGDVIRLYATLDQTTADSGAADTSAIAVPELQYVEVLAATNQNARDVVSANERMGQEVTDSDRQIATVTLAVSDRQARVLAGLNQNATLYAALIVRGDADAKQKALDAQNAYFTQADAAQTPAPVSAEPEGTGGE
jgi:Flp pilus assembly protein CpaB